MSPGSARAIRGVDHEGTGAPARPPSVERPPWRPAPAPALVTAGLLLAAVVLPLLRQQGVPSWRSVWAEDGFLLYQDATGPSPLGSLFHGYAGYLVLPPRLLALPTRWLPVEALPWYLAVVAAVVTAVLAALVFRWTRTWISSPTVRLALATLVVLMPAAGLENTGTLTNTIWAFSAVVPWALLSREQGRADVAARGAVCFAAATGSPLGLVFVPLALLVWWRRRDVASALVSVAYGAGVALQLAVMAFTETKVNALAPQRPMSDIVDLLGVRIFTLYLVGPDRATSLWQDHGTVVGVLAAVVVLGLFALVWRGAPQRAQQVGLLFLAYAIGTFTVLIVGRGTQPFRWGPFNMSAHMRYSVATTLLLASAFAVLVAPAGARAAARPVARVGRAVLVGHLAVLVVACFAVDAHRSVGPEWRVHVADAAARCEGRPPDHVELVLQDAQPFWAVRIPCRELRP